MNSQQEHKGILFITEVGSVHDGSWGNALRMIDIASNIGADAVKFQTHIPAAETLRDAPMPPYFKGEPRFEYFQRTGFSLAQWKEMHTLCEEKQIEFISSPFSIEAVDLLEDVGVRRYKIPSGEVTNLPMLAHIAQTGKPIIISSGMSSWQELDAAIDLCLQHHDKLTVLQCTSEYPCAYKNVGLNVMLEMKERYQLPVGLSDHTLTPYASLAAVALGATVIEKHLTFSRFMYGSDARHSMEPQEMVTLIEGVRAIETMLASQVKKDKMIERLGGMKATFEKSLVSLVDIPAGTHLTEGMIGAKKPGTGMSAARYSEVIGKKTTRNISKDTLLRESDLKK